MDHFDGDDAEVDRIILLFDLPLIIDTPSYWHVWLTGAEYHAYNKEPSNGPWSRSRALLRRLVSLHWRTPGEMIRT